MTIDFIIQKLLNFVLETLNKTTMKIDSVIIKDVATGKFFAFIRQFPCICAQANSIQEVDVKINSYFKSFIDKIKNESDN